MNTVKILWSEDAPLTKAKPIGVAVASNDDLIVVQKFDGQMVTLNTMEAASTVVVDTAIPKNLPLKDWAARYHNWAHLSAIRNLDDVPTRDLEKLLSVSSMEVRGLVTALLCTPDHELNEFQRSVRDSTVTPWFMGSSRFKTPMSVRQAEALLRQRGLIEFTGTNEAKFTDGLNILNQEWIVSDWPVLWEEVYNSYGSFCSLNRQQVPARKSTLFDFEDHEVFEFK
jgi:hypothetical protein